MDIVDAHLDLAWNATRRGRDIRLPAAEQPRADNETAMVGLPDLNAGHVTLVCGTLFSTPDDNARNAALEQLTFYENLAAQNEIDIVRSARQIRPIATTEATRIAAPSPTQLILLMEGADPITGPGDVPFWFDRGVRMVGLAWQATRHTAGTGKPGGLTDLGRSVVPALDEAGILHDASHLAERALDELLDLATGPICASHSNCRAIVGDDPAGRHLPDRQIRAITTRDGVIGINAFNKFLLPAGRPGPSTLADMVTHIRRVCDLAGDAAHVGLGTDLDGGLGREHTPTELNTIADLPKLADSLSDHFDDAAIKNILAGNWHRFFRENLPQ